MTLTFHSCERQKACASAVTFLVSQPNGSKLYYLVTQQGCEQLA